MNLMPGHGYKAKLISTIVDIVVAPAFVWGYKAKLISTIVDSTAANFAKSGL